MYLSYKKSYEPEAEQDNTYKVNCFTTRLFKLFMPHEERSLKSALSGINFVLLTGGKAKIYYVTSDDGSIIHTSFVVSKCFKFPFLGKTDFEIGPCATGENCRGRGIYPSVLKYILSSKEYESADFYKIVSDSNLSSIKGIEKSGFERCGTIKKTKVLKRYRREKEVSDE